MKGSTVGSFTIKLVVYFLLLSVLPMVAAFWGFTAVAGQSETRKADARQQAGLRAVLASYQERIDGAQREAVALARLPSLQKQIQVRDLPGVVHVLRNASIVRNAGNVSVTAVGGFRVNRPAAFAVTRASAVVTRDGLAGYVTVAVPFDGALVDLLRRRSG